MNNAFLLIGGNIGDRIGYLNKACELIDKNTGTIVVKSSVFETAAWGVTEQASFLNQVLHVKTDLLPPQLLKQILANEAELGRRRIEKMGPRIIDIDILFYNNAIVNTAELTIPHPEIPNRRFVLIPLNELVPDLVHPILNKTVRELLNECRDKLEVKVYGKD
ncbi:MAG: 2-amino-4-hydroxy-6-hydroxymethyldihydropteridine pyrophosphokinae [Segetibacter sp.]|nr:2-amino-4-hydroxy-6-hydroxymethyldihydropteridine pyrophosphokinae [Segetibacter sp.]